MAWFDVFPLDHESVSRFNVSFQIPKHTGELTACSQNEKAGNPWFTLTASTLGKEAVEGRDGFTVMVLPEKEKTTAICWEMIGASVIET
jgi:hypothetical protein